jgi:drug/metabolite transporter (DMT)-like permease
MNTPKSLSMPPVPAWIAFMPPAFVLLWSTGFIGAKFSLPYAEPFTLLSLRFAIAASTLTLFSLYIRAPWPNSFAQIRDAVIVGVLLHGTYLGGVFLGISLGTGAGVSAMITGLQPILAATLAIPLMVERISKIQMVGLIVGFIGLVLVVWTGQGAGSWAGVVASLAALAGITLATLYQKRFVSGCDLRTSSAVQLIAAFICVFPLALVLETRNVIWTGEFLIALTWLALPMSVGTFSLLQIMIRYGAVAKVTSLFYLVPPVVAIESWFLFGEMLNLYQGVGMVFATCGVALIVTRKKTNEEFSK